MEHWSTIFDIVEHGIAGDAEKCRAYAELLIQRLENAGDTGRAERLREILQGRDKGLILHVTTTTY